MAKSKTAKWRKFDVADVIDAHASKVAEERLRRQVKEKAAAGDLFEIDTVGKLNRRQEKKIATLQRGSPTLTKKQIEKRQHWADERKKALRKQELARKARKRAFDVWSGPTAEELAKKRRRLMGPMPKLFSDVPAVIPPTSGQSANPSDASWKKELIAAAAIAALDKDRNEVMFNTLQPVASRLMDIFPEDAITGLTNDEQIALFRMVCDSEDLPEEPEDFLKRVLPTIQSGLTNTAAEVKVKIKQEPTEDDRISSKKTAKRKTEKDRAREARRKAQDKELEEKRRRKAKNREFDRLDAIAEEVRQAQADEIIRRQLNESERAYWEAAAKRGEVKSFKIGKNQYIPEPVSVSMPEDLALSGGSLRKVKAQTQESLRSRWNSIKQRGMIELPAAFTGERYQKLRSRLHRQRNDKVRRAERLSTL